MGNPESPTRARARHPRQRFERWYRAALTQVGDVFARQGEGYENPYVHLAWLAWKAGRRDAR